MDQISTSFEENVRWFNETLGVGRNCDLVSHVVLDSEADLARYQKDPDHLAVVPLIQANFCDRRCCDIPADGL